ncbi:MAG: hypothetical protein ACI8RZ_003613 [Myxococcota bacterium]|jgi:hypothetical protein
MKRLRVVVAITSLLPLGCGGLSALLPCPSDITEGQSCMQADQYCPQPNLDEHGCGVEGFTCTAGIWAAELTTCNPPEPPPPPCPEGITSGSACAEDGQYCPQPNLDEHGCGVEGFTCTVGIWADELTTCNPPEPPQPG